MTRPRKTPPHHAPKQRLELERLRLQIRKLRQSLPDPTPPSIFAADPETARISEETAALFTEGQRVQALIDKEEERLHLERIKEEYQQMTDTGTSITSV